MPYFDRLDICEAYLCLEWDYHRNGILRERPSNRRRNESTGWQLFRIGFKPSPTLCTRNLSDNARAIYDAAVERLGLPKGEE